MFSDAVASAPELFVQKLEDLEPFCIRFGRGDGRNRARSARVVFIIETFFFFEFIMRSLALGVL
jgi:hypothetical protein